MPETYIVSVKTEDGALLAQKKITGDLEVLLYRLFLSSRVLSSASKDSKKSKTRRGSGTSESAGDFSSPTQS